MKNGGIERRYRGELNIKPVEVNKRVPKNK